MFKKLNPVVRVCLSKSAFANGNGYGTCGSRCPTPSAPPGAGYWLARSKMRVMNTHFSPTGVHGVGLW